MFARLNRNCLFKRVIAVFIILQFVASSLAVKSYAAASNLRPAAAQNDDSRRNAIVNDLRGTPKDSGNLADRIIVNLNELRKGDGSIAGGKSSNLGELMSIPGMPVPPGYATTVKAFKMHINNNYVNYQGKRMTIQEFILARTKGLDYSSEVALGPAASDIRDAIIAAPMPKEVEDEIRARYAELGEGSPVAVRSSATAEDLPEASFAGQQETFLNIRGIDAVLVATKKCWASLYNHRAMSYRFGNWEKLGLTEEKAYLSVVIQRMVNADAAGVAFTVDLEYGSPGIVINANPKLGEAVVSGTVTPDQFNLVYDVKTGNPKVFKKRLGAKLKKVVNSATGTEYVDTTPEEQKTFCITNAQAEKIGKYAKQIKAHYDDMIMDVEWAIENGKVYIVQARADTVWNKKPKDAVEMDFVQVVESETKHMQENSILEGIAGSARAATGRVVKILIEPVIDAKTGEVDVQATSLQLTRELDKVKEGDVMVTKMTNPDMVSAMKRAAAIVTDEGGMTCHAAIVARELEKPCVVGTRKATLVLKDGDMVTVDANKGIISPGSFPLERKVLRIHLPSLPELKTKIGLILSEPDLAAKIWQFSTYNSYYGFGLVRKEHVDLTQTLMHPRGGMDYDRYYDPNFKDQSKKQWIKEHIIDKYGDKIKQIIGAYPTFEAFYTDKIKNALVQMAAAQTKGQRIKFRGPDFKSNEFRGLLTGEAYEPEESNPMAGNRGVHRILTEEYLPAFRLDCRALKEARKIRSNIDIMFPVVRTPEELIAAVEIMAEEGLFKGKEKPQIGAMVELAADVYQVEEIYKTLRMLADKYGTKAFMSIGSNDLTQFTLGAGRDNEKMVQFASFKDPAVMKSIEILIKTAKKYGIFTGICGEAPSKDPSYAAFLVECGIDSISVAPEVFEKVVRVVAEAEKKMEGKPFDPKIAGWTYPSELQMGNPEKIIAEKVDASQIILDLKIHPQALLDYVRGTLKDTLLSREIKGMLGDKNVKDLVVDAVSTAILEKVKTTDPQTPIIYTTDDNQNTQYKKQVNGEDYEGFDENPFIGFCGLARVVDYEWEAFFRWQLEGVKKARETSGRKNIGIRLDLSTVLPNIDKALAIMKEEGLVPGQDGLMVGVEIAKSGTGLLLNEIIDRGITFLSENQTRFLSYMLPEDPGSQYVSIPLDRKQRALINAQKIWTTTAEQRGVPLVSFTDPEGVLADGGTPVTQRVVIGVLFRGIMDKYGALKASQELSLSREELEAILWTLNDQTVASPLNGIKSINNIENVIGRLSADQKSVLKELAQGIIFANHGLDKKVKDILINSSEATVYKALSNGFGNFVNSLKGLESSPAALLIGANTVFENAGTLSALKKIKDAQPGLKIA
ncbi:MAG: phosphoenolpyruvate synthase [Candidatus Omnitrophica bacterium]|nr:phosphoenolpyruvate synthase [Candidatus Omnitrophota bacterium]